MEDPIVNTRAARWSSYAISFLITALIFGTALYASNYFGARRLAEIRAAQDTISTDILSLETQFDLLQEHSCDDVTEDTILPSELTSLGSRLAYMEAQGARTRDEVVRLKRLYSLLEIKDYLLMKQVAARCGLKPVFILYFYSNERECGECEKQGYALTALAEKYPQLRIYSFDYDLDVSALRTLISVTGIRDDLPALYLNGAAHYGFKSVGDIEGILPQLAEMRQAATSTAQRATSSPR